jgi:threonine aldolase
MSRSNRMYSISRLRPSPSLQNHLHLAKLLRGRSPPQLHLHTVPRCWPSSYSVSINSPSAIRAMASSASAPTQNAWSAPGPAASDFRSDVMTTPTTAMLNAIAATTLRDDVFQEDPTTNDLESFVAKLAGKEAGLLVLSGTMGNQVALRAHLGGPPNSVLCDQRAHILNHEAGGAASLSGALICGITPANGTYLTADEVKKHAVISDDVHTCPTSVISLENTISGNILPLDEVKKISAFARQHGIIMHLDGARLWEAVASGAGSLEEYCEQFDTVSLCFSKGLGAPIGSILLGTTAFLKRARWIRKMIGGGLRQAGVVSAAARVSVEETFLGGKLAQSHENAKRIGKTWVDLGGKLRLPVETNMVWLDIAAIGLEKATLAEMAAAKGLYISGGRLVVHYQISDESIQKLEGLMKDMIAQKK